MTHEELKISLFNKSKKIKDAYDNPSRAYKIGRNVKELRIKNKLTQKELANLLGTKQSSIARLENGNSGLPSDSFLKRIAEALNTSLTIPTFLDKTKNEDCVDTQTVTVNFLQKNVVCKTAYETAPQFSASAKYSLA